MSAFSTFHLAVAAGILLTSCVESDAVYFLNPDGSGKVEHRVKIRKSFGNWSGEEPDKEMAMNLIRGSEGIVAWTNVHHRQTDGGEAIEFSGTGYFPKLSEVFLGCARGSDGAATRIPIPKLEWEPDATGKGAITLRDPFLLDKGDGTNESEGEDAAASLYGLQFSLQSSYRCEVRVAGSLSEAAGFEINEDGTSAVFVHDPRLLEEQEESEMEKQRVGIEQAGGLETVAKGGIVENVPLQTVIFERTPPFSIRVDASKAVFDYQAEVAAAEIKVDHPSEPKREGWKPLKSIEGP